MFLTLAVWLSSSIAVAQSAPEGTPAKRGQRQMGQGHNALNLTDAQQEQVKALHLEMAKTTLTNKNRINELEAKLTTATSQDKVDQKEVDGIVSEMFDLKEANFKEHLQTRNEVRALLSDEQKVMFDVRHAKRRNGKGMQARGHRRHGGGAATNRPCQQ